MIAPGLGREPCDQTPPSSGGRSALPPCHLLTGEYPPQPGGVADYTAVVAAGLAAAGVEVHIWAPPAAGRGPEPDGVTVHRAAGRWLSADLDRLGAALDTFPTPRWLLVQYSPNALGRRGLNLGFCRWLSRRRARGDEIWTMVHELAYPFYLWDKPVRWVFTVVHRLMLRTLVVASAQLYYAMARGEHYLRFYGAGLRRPMTWLPVPSNVPAVDDPDRVAELRRRLAPRGERIIGSFGTFGESTERGLRVALPRLLAEHPDRVGLLIGRRGDRFAAALAAEHPELAGRLVATGGLAPEVTSLHLQACDVLVQPYFDGVSTRRGSVMAGLEHGRPIATNAGHNTEPLWGETGCVALAPAVDYEALAWAAEALLADPAARARLGAVAREVYERRFAVERTVAVLLADAQNRLLRGAPCDGSS